ncbi:MAG: sporulation protein YqfD [Clostridia bacterium]|nr:sporulation protein YqfD [Clostridia bacterium]
MLWLFRFLRGYLFIEIKGEYFERILNLAAANRITIWNLRCEKNRITGCISINGFRKIRIIKRKTGVRIKILKKNGLPFIAVRYKNRIGFIAGAVIFFAVLKFMSSFIWTINAVGNVNISDNDVINACGKIGIHEGKLISKIDPQFDAQRLLLNTKGLSWASLNIEGCVLSVNVTEVQNSTDEKDTAPSNLKSKCDGIIEKIDVTSGNVVVKVGDTVASGDLLVSGIIESMDSTVFVRSVGTVTAQTEHTFSKTGKFSDTVNKKTGKTVKRSVIDLFGLKIPLYIGEVKGTYESKVKTHNAKLFNKKLPISITVKKYILTDEKEIKYNKDTLKNKLETEIKEEIESNKFSEYDITDINESETDGELTVTITLKAKENIEIEEKMLISTVN